MFNLLNHHRNVNKNHFEIIILHLSGCLRSIKQDSSWWCGCGTKGTLIHYWWECKLLQPLWNQSGSSLETLHQNKSSWWGKGMSEVGTHDAHVSVWINVHMVGQGDVCGGYTRCTCECIDKHAHGDPGYPGVSFLGCIPTFCLRWGL